ncbi:MAG: ribonuclease J [Oligoflexales bacterium]
MSHFNNKSNAITLIPLGGCGEFGMNMTYYTSGKTKVLVDCGLMFPEPYKLGVHGMLPDLEPFYKQLGEPNAYVITHGHEDHIGALPAVLKRWNKPVYATPWTVDLIEQKLEQHGLKAEIHTVQAGQTIQVGELSFRYVHVNHSIPHACALLISNKHTKVFHTGDFKFDFEAPDKPIDVEELKAIGDQGVHAVVADSTNAHKDGMGPSEVSTLPALRKLLSQAEGRTFVTTFASNLWRLRNVAKLCQELGKRLYVEGRGIHKSLDLAKKHGLWDFPDDWIVQEKALDHIENKDLVIMLTGSQGEPRSALMRIAYGEHRFLHFEEGDTLLYSARMIPGNERSIFQLFSELRYYGVDIITPREENIHVSGHAYGGEVERLMDLLRPTHYFPVHGTFSQLMDHGQRAENKGIPTTVLQDGECVNITAEGVNVESSPGVSAIYLDQDSPLMLSHATLRERLRIGETGLLVLSGVYSRKTGKWLHPISMESHGISPYASLDPLVQQIKKRFDEWSRKDDCEDQVIQWSRRFCKRTIQRRPVVISKIFVTE